jgi:molybdopterin biosynthesis enzyme
MKLGAKEVHEEEAALRIASAISGPGLKLIKPKEGKVSIIAKIFGILTVNIRLLQKINSLGDIVVSTLHNNTVCTAGTIVAATRIIPLYANEEKIVEAEKTYSYGKRIIAITPFKQKKVGIIITGNEVYKSRIKDKFGEIMEKKISALGSTINDQAIVPDNILSISQVINDMKNKGSEIIVVCGGLSVDPDDVTIEGVRKSGAKIIIYGAPVIPGSMFLLAMLKNIPILGAPACVIFDETTIFDIILPRVLVGEKLRRQDITRLGHGGLCLNCIKCSFPICPFGK